MHPLPTVYRAPTATSMYYSTIAESYQQVKSYGVWGWSESSDFQVRVWTSPGIVEIDREIICTLGGSHDWELGRVV